MSNFRHHLLAMAVTSIALPAWGQTAPTELFISEYIEGSSQNKAVEIYNGTGQTIDLANYELQFFFNGSTSAGRIISLSGSVASGDVYVVAQATADPAILAEADLTDTATTWYNGDDAVVLFNNGSVIDLVGQIGFDPGSQWGSGDTSTQDNTILRLASICAGDTNSADTFDPSLEWTGLAQNTYTELGSHSVDCGAAPPPPPPPPTGISLISEVQGNGAATPFNGQMRLFYSRARQRCRHRFDDV